MHARGSTILMTLVDQNRGAFAAEPAAHTIVSNSLVRIEIADDDTGLFVGLLDLEDGAKARGLAAWFRAAGSAPLPADPTGSRSCEDMRLFEGNWEVGPQQGEPRAPPTHLTHPLAHTPRPHLTHPSSTLFCSQSVYTSTATHGTGHDRRTRTTAQRRTT
jgi:hypothetical protein